MEFRRLKLQNLAVAVMLMILTARVAWHALHTAVGWEYLGEQWTTNTGRLVGVDRPELSAQEPEDQARLWLAETERVVRSQETPEIAAGTAWLLDAPQTGFIVRHFRENKALKAFPELPLAVPQGIGYDAVARA